MPPRRCRTVPRADRRAHDVLVPGASAMSEVRSSPVRSPLISPLISPWRAVRVIFMVTALVVAVGSSTAVSVGASSDVYQDTEPDDPAVADDDEFDGRSTADTVNIVVGSLIAVAGGTAFLMLMFIWHTNPRRRLRVAIRRAERRRAKVAQNEDESEDVGDHGNAGEGDVGEGEDHDAGDYQRSGADRSEDAGASDSRE